MCAYRTLIPDARGANSARHYRRDDMPAFSRSLPPRFCDVIAATTSQQRGGEDPDELLSQPGTNIHPLNLRPAFDLFTARIRLYSQVSANTFPGKNSCPPLSKSTPLPTLYLPTGARPSPCLRKIPRRTPRSGPNGLTQSSARSAVRRGRQPWNVY